MAEQVNETDKQNLPTGNDPLSIASQFLEQPQPPATELIGNKAAANHWSVSEKQIKEWVKSGMPITGPNNNRTFNISECENWFLQLKESEQKTVQDDRETIRGPRRGDDCPDDKCPGKLTAYSQSRTDNGKIYFLSCGRCNAKPEKNKEVITNG